MASQYVRIVVAVIISGRTRVSSAPNHHEDCRTAFTVKAGSVMQASNVPVQKWAMAIYLMLTARRGMSSLPLSKELGITQKSAWFMTRRIREACDQGHFILKKEVAVDET